MRKAWFVYEAGSTGPRPAIYYDDLPNEKNALNKTVLQKHSLSQEWFENDVNVCPDCGPDMQICDEVQVSFVQLCNTFPYTGSHYNLE